MFQLKIRNKNVFKEKKITLYLFKINKKMAKKENVKRSQSVVCVFGVGVIFIFDIFDFIEI